jgi:uncharacterized DUF497 family protein
VDIECDPAKSDRNALKRGLPFSRVVDFEFETAVIAEDTRADYGEKRWIAVA